MKKIIAFILASFFLLLSPLSAFASTTESAIMYNNTRSIPTNHNLALSTVLYNSDTGSFLSGSSTNLVDDSSSSYASWMPSSSLPVSKSKVGYTLSYDGSITGNQYNSNIIDISMVETALSYGGTYYCLSPFAVPSIAYVEFSGVYQFQIYDGSVGYERWIYDNSFVIRKSLEVSTSDFGLYRLYTSGAYNPNSYAGYDLNLSYSSLTAADLLNTVDVKETISNYVEFQQSTVSDTTFSSVEDFPTSKIRIFPRDVKLVVLYDIIPQNFFGFFDSSLSLPLFSTLNGVGFYNRVSPTYYNSNLTSVDIVGLKNTEVSDMSFFSLVSSNFYILRSSLGSGLSNIVTNATDNANRIIQNTTQKVDEVKQGVTEVKDSVIETKNSILDLPNKIKDMLLGLIVPSSETMSNKFSEFSDLLEEKLGIIYQVPMMLFDFFDTIVNAATTPQTTLTLPAFQLPWIDGTTLTVWQPIEYRIIPEGMQVLSDLIKTITSMTVVVLTFNSVKRAYERFLRS